MIKILALGDSYTAGQSITPEERYIHQLADLLRENGAPQSHIKIVAKGGWKAETLKGGLDEAIPGLNVTDPEHGKTLYDYDLVTLLVGVNDVMIGNYIPVFKEQYSMLLERTRRLAGGDASRVLVMNLPAFGHTPDAHNPKSLANRGTCGFVKLHEQSKPEFNTPQGIQHFVERYNLAIANMVKTFNAKLPEKKRATLVDIHSITTQLPVIVQGNGSPMHAPEYFDARGVHYKPEMYRQWAEALLPHALGILKTKPAPHGITVH